MCCSRPATRWRSGWPRRAAPRRSAPPARWPAAPRRSRGSWGPSTRSSARSSPSSARLERERRDSQVQLAEMVRALSAGTDTLRRETGELVSALKRPETRGSWGEIQLRRVVELAGMVAHCDFIEQSTIHTDDGRLRPDLLVRLPGGKLIVVDSKVPLDAYLAALEAGEDDRPQRRAGPRAPRPPDARAHHQARLQGLPAPVRLDAGARRDVRALRRHLPGRARRGSRADRVRRRSSRS